MWCGNATKGRLSFVAIAAILGALPAAAQECAAPVGQVASAEGSVEIQGAGGGVWRVAAAGDSLCKEDTLRTGSLSRAAVTLINDEVLRLDEGTTLRLADVPVDTAQPTLLDLAFGAVQSFSRSPKHVNVKTSYMTLAIRGTEFMIRAAKDESVLTVFEGEVLASNALGELPVPGGQSAVARAGQAPQAYLVARPRDAAQWSLYYPPIFSAPPGDGPELAEAQRLAGAGDVAGALAALDRSPGQAGAAEQTYRAALLLQVGRAVEANAALDAALKADPGSSDALALRAVIGVVQNQRERGPGRRPQGGGAGAELGRRQDRALPGPAGDVRYRRRSRDDGPGRGGAAERRAGLGQAVGAVADGRLSAPIA